LQQKPKEFIVKSRNNVICSSEEAWSIIDERVALAAADVGESTAVATEQQQQQADNHSNMLLWDAVHYLEQHSFQLSDDEKQQLWQNAHGSWKLVLSTGSSKSHDFHLPPKFLPFSFAMIDDTYFGNGVGLNENQIWIALRDKHTYDYNKRRLQVSVDDVFLFGHQITPFPKLPKLKLPSFMTLLSKQTDGVDDESSSSSSQPHQKKSPNKPPPTFVLIGSSQHTLIARGNQSGGLALWTRLQNDICPVAYSTKAPNQKS
jgi:hypothetical protein